MPPRPLENWTIAWDLDGTLVETAPDLVRALNLTLAGQNMPKADLADARDFVGHGARSLIERAAAHFHRVFSSAELDALTDEFIQHYRADIARDSHIFGGTRDTLDSLRALGATHVVCTNKRTDLSVQLLDALEITDRFAAIIGADSVSRRKPDAAHLLEALAAAGGDPLRAVMVGDSRTDADAARAARVPFVLVSFGYAGEVLEGIPHDALAHDSHSVAAACLRLAAARV